MNEFLNLISILCEQNTDALIKKYPLNTPRGLEDAEKLQRFWRAPDDRSLLEIVEVSDYFWTCHDPKLTRGLEYRNIQAFILLLLINNYEKHGNTDDVSWPINYSLICLHQLCNMSHNHTAWEQLEKWYSKLIRLCLLGGEEEKQDAPFFKAAELLAIASRQPVEEIKISNTCKDYLELRDSILRECFASDSNDFVVVPNGYNQLDVDWRRAFEMIPKISFQTRHRLLNPVVL